MAVLDWLQQLLGGGQQADPAARAVERPYDYGQAYQPPPQPPSPTVAEAYDTAMGLTGIPDMQQAYQAYQRGEYLPALGQGVAGLANAASIAVPALRAAGPVARTVGPLLGDEIGAIGDVGRIRAYHGSPHSFDRFDLSKIGTGEGAQAYGHGLYFAESEPVARAYKEKLSGIANTAYARPPSALEQQGLDIVNRTGVSRRWDASPAELRQRLIDNYSSTLATAPESAIYGGRAKVEADVAALKALDPTLFKPPGHMYEVDINAKPEDFLNWDKPISEQSSSVQGGLEKLSDVYGLRDISLSLFPGQTPVGRHAYAQIARNSSPNYDIAQRAAAEELGHVGIPGMRYLDQGSRSAGEGSSNYAIWTPEIITILRRYGLLPPLAAGGLLAAPGQGEAAPP